MKGEPIDPARFIEGIRQFAADVPGLWRFALLATELPIWTCCRITRQTLYPITSLLGVKLVSAAPYRVVEQQVIARKDLCTMVAGAVMAIAEAFGKIVAEKSACYND